MSSPTGSSQWLANPGGDFYDFEVANSLLLAGGGALEWTNNEANTAYWTFSCWIKRAKLAGNYNVVLGSTNYAGTYTLDIVGFDGSPVDEFLALQFSNASGVSKVVNSAADEVFQDLNAWYHYHVTNNNKISKNDLLVLFRKFTNKDIDIQPISGKNIDKSFLDTRLLINYKIPTYEKMVFDMVEQTINNKIYSKYMIKNFEKKS